MAKTHLLKFRVTKSQLELIRENANRQGYLRLSPFIRDQIFRRPDFLERKIVEIDRYLKKALESANHE